MNAEAEEEKDRVSGANEGFIVNPPLPRITKGNPLPATKESRSFAAFSFFSRFGVSGRIYLDMAPLWEWEKEIASKAAEHAPLPLKTPQRVKS